MKRLRMLFLTILLLGFVITPAPALAISLFEFAFNIDGSVSNITELDPLPAGVSIAGFDQITGLGTITVTLGGIGDHYVGLFVDHDIDADINTFFNEYGWATGAPALGLSWEIDEPGYFFGDVYDNFLAGALDNTNGVPSSSPDDVSMALAWDFALAADETALVSFLLGVEAPTSGFYLTHHDPDSDASIYLWSTLEIRGGPSPVPEPGLMILLGVGLVGLLGVGRWGSMIKA